MNSLKKIREFRFEVRSEIVEYLLRWKTGKGNFHLRQGKGKLSGGPQAAHCVTFEFI